MKCLNLGCGTRFHSDWVNLDLNPSSSHIGAFDLRKGIPFPDQSFSVVYHSHLLEHLPKNEAKGFLQECFRVLVPGGIIRVAVPDLEQIVRAYLSTLEKSLEGQTEAQVNYEWIMLELYDQTVRESPGGEMLKYLNQNPVPNLDFVYSRIGGEAKKIIIKTQNKNDNKLRKNTTKNNFTRRIRHLPKRLRDQLVKHILGNQDIEALKIGRFRMSGEVHKWMYDRYSLSKVLEEAGFAQVVKREATESAIPEWCGFNLDTDADGSVYKPDSLFMEATRLA